MLLTLITLNFVTIWVLIKIHYKNMKLQNKLNLTNKSFLMKIKDKKLRKYIHLALKYNLINLEKAKRITNHKYSDQDYIRLEKLLTKLLLMKLKER